MDSFKRVGPRTWESPMRPKGDIKWTTYMVGKTEFDTKLKYPNAKTMPIVSKHGGAEYIALRIIFETEEEECEFILREGAK